MPLDLTATPLGCLRSTKRVPGAGGARAEARPLDVACASAGVSDMTSAQQTYLGTNPPQLNALAPGDAVVMLTLGGDDMGFVTRSTVHGAERHRSVGQPVREHSPAAAPISSRPGSAPRRREDRQLCLTTIARRAPRGAGRRGRLPGPVPAARRLLAGGADHRRRHRATCARIEVQLNAMLAGDARAAGATFVDTYTPTIGHDFCQSAKVKDVEGLVPLAAAALPPERPRPGRDGRRGARGYPRLELLGVPGPRRSERCAGAGQAAAGQFVGQPQQRVRRAGHHVLRDVGDPVPARPRRARAAGRTPPWGGACAVRRARRWPAPPGPAKPGRARAGPPSPRAVPPRRTRPSGPRTRRAALSVRSRSRARVARPRRGRRGRAGPLAAARRARRRLPGRCRRSPPGRRRTGRRARWRWSGRRRSRRRPPSRARPCARPHRRALRCRCSVNAHACLLPPTQQPCASSTLPAVTVIGRKPGRAGFRGGRVGTERPGAAWPASFTGELGQRGERCCTCAADGLTHRAAVGEQQRGHGLVAAVDAHHELSAVPGHARCRPRSSPRRPCRAAPSGACRTRTRSSCTS